MNLLLMCGQRYNFDFVTELMMGPSALEGVNQKHEHLGKGPQS
jgi:hypothetical protein